MNIRMVDTITQYQKIKDEIDLELNKVFESGAYINGPIVKQFRNNLSQFLNGAHVVACANGTDALQVALMAAGVQPGDEVITTPFTFVATVEVVALLGAKPVFVDVDPQTFNIDPEKIEAAITPKTKAIVPVHLFGQCSDMESILSIAQKHGICVIEDAAQSIGAEFTFSDGRVEQSGTMGDMGTTSFYPSKNLGAFGDAGAIFSNNDELADKAQVICNHGSEVKYYHQSIGVNSRLDSMQAAVLDVKLRYLKEYNQARNEAADLYDSLLSDCDDVFEPYRAPYSTHVFHQYTLRIKAGRKARDLVQAKLNEMGVPSMIYYPVSLHLQGAYEEYGYQPGDFPVSEKLTEEVLSLPMHTELDESQQTFIINSLKQALTFSKTEKV